MPGWQFCIRGFSITSQGYIVIMKRQVFLEGDKCPAYLQNPEFPTSREVCPPEQAQRRLQPLQEFCQSNTACPGQSCFGKTFSSPARSKKKASTPLPKCCQLHLNRKAPLRCGVRLGSTVPVTLAGWNTLKMPLQRHVVPACEAVYDTVPLKTYS